MKKLLVLLALLSFKAQLANAQIISDGTSGLMVTQIGNNVVMIGGCHVIDEDSTNYYIASNWHVVDSAKINELTDDQLSSVILIIAFGSKGQIQVSLEQAITERGISEVDVRNDIFIIKSPKQYLGDSLIPIIWPDTYSKPDSVTGSVFRNINNQILPQKLSGKTGVAGSCNAGWVQGDSGSCVYNQNGEYAGMVWGDLSLEPNEAGMLLPFPSIYIPYQKIKACLDRLQARN